MHNVVPKLFHTTAQTKEIKNVVCYKDKRFCKVFSKN